MPRNRRGIQLYTMRRIMEKSQADASSVLRWLGRTATPKSRPPVTMAGLRRSSARELDRAGLKASRAMTGPTSPSRPAGRTATRQRWHTRRRWARSSPVSPGQNLPTTERAIASSRQPRRGGQACAQVRPPVLLPQPRFRVPEQAGRTATRSTTSCSRRPTGRYVKFELDLFWITEGGANGVEYLSADPTRYIGYHVKDHVWGDRPNANDYEDAGPGMLDFPDLFEAGDGGRQALLRRARRAVALAHGRRREAEYMTAENGIRYLETVRW